MQRSPKEFSKRAKEGLWKHLSKSDFIGFEMIVKSTIEQLKELDTQGILFKPFINVLVELFREKNMQFYLKNEKMLKDMEEIMIKVQENIIELGVSDQQQFIKIIRNFDKNEKKFHDNHEKLLDRLQAIRSLDSNKILGVVNKLVDMYVLENPVIPEEIQGLIGRKLDEIEEFEEEQIITGVSTQTGFARTSFGLN
jgi:hypothetical protein